VSYKLVEDGWVSKREMLCDSSIPCSDEQPLFRSRRPMDEFTMHIYRCVSFDLQSF